MLEQKFAFTVTDENVIEKVIEDDNAAINHMVLRNGEALPEHYSNSNVYMIVARGEITLRLGEQEPHAYPTGSIVTIPYRTKMNVYNAQDIVTEIFVVKAPSPKHMG
jgi:quercetin dioxygenase-like cupin family protein